MKKQIFPNCGNAPKMGTVIDLVVALAGRSPNAAKKIVREDFIFSSVTGEDSIAYDELAEKLLHRPKVSKIVIENAMSHGKAAMCEGVMHFTDKDHLYFCAVAEFASTTKDAFITSLRMYYVKQ